ncbi:hypothetical protein CARUB_v10024539mg [Capsella rubella]|uniref:X8 domain-containing protein n=2 Tax=Capsella rubella TaxID=81985 RepID=R0HW84_9BRAS|nr:hypothetical protein CARUB_v10024539mg [Capsella rubella]
MSRMLNLQFIFISSIIMIHYFPIAISTKWCVANTASTNVQLQANINFGCSQGVDCSQIRSGGSCFSPNTLINHASYVMNAYYQSHGRTTEACNFIFGNTGMFTTINPSYGGCVFRS